MNAQELAQASVNKMLSKDKFSEWLGIEVVEIKPGFSKLKMQIREEMLNGFDILHGGVSFSLADSALAFASNSHGRLSLAIEAGMSFPKAVLVNDVITATANQVSLTNKLGTYDIKIHNQKNELVGLFKGTVYRTSKNIVDE
ncbi:MAG: hotdog fold thioesterase [Bacteroidia bacterium]|nr:hotdog fold thioesterase [Bacteroidia bacterium]NNC85626.1 hotdog fold thioesterase [Bacteroidia bacterium]